MVALYSLVLIIYANDLLQECCFLASWYPLPPNSIFPNSYALFQDHPLDLSAAAICRTSKVAINIIIITTSYPFISHNFIVTIKVSKLTLAPQFCQSVLVPVSNLLAWIPQLITTITGSISTISPFSPVFISVLVEPQDDLLHSCSLPLITAEGKPHQVDWLYSWP